jgi:hypothetical protein
MIIAINVYIVVIMIDAIIFFFIIIIISNGYHEHQRLLLISFLRPKRGNHPSERSYLASKIYSWKLVVSRAVLSKLFHPLHSCLDDPRAAVLLCFSLRSFHPYGSQQEARPVNSTCTKKVQRKLVDAKACYEPKFHTNLLRQINHIVL